MIKKFTLILIFLILLFSLFFRFYDLNMDPFPYNTYGMGYIDEGGYIHNARNKVIFDQWELEGDSWNPLYLSPLFTYLEYFSFSKLGVSSFSMRIVSALLGIISILIANLLIMKRNFRAGLFFLILSSINIMLIVYSRVATLQSLLLFFIFLILGLIVYDIKLSWMVVGFLVPCLFFSKFTSLFFIAAIPLSLLLYYWKYKQKQTLKNMGYFVLGGIISSILWLFWLIPNFKSWFFMAKMMSHPVGPTLFKLLAAPLHFLKFSLINPLIVVLAGVSIFFTIYYLRKKREIPFLDFFLLISLVMFLFHLLVIDFFLRRWVLIVPIILLIAALFISRIKGIKFYFSHSLFKINKKTIIGFILAIYLILNLAQLAGYFGQLATNENEIHTVVSNSKEISEHIPPGANVYGLMAMALNSENQIKPYYIYQKSLHVDTEAYILPLFKEKKINYAILRFDLNNNQDLKRNDLNLEESELYNHIGENFEIIKILDGKNWLDNSLGMKIYIYRRS